MSRFTSHFLRHGGWALAATALAIGGSVSRAELPDRIALGADGDGTGCTGNRDFRAPDLTGAFDKAYVVTCDGAAASRPVARVSAVAAKKRTPEPDGDCGAASPIAIAGGNGSVRRCNDRALGETAFVITFVRGGKSYRGASLSSAFGPMTRALAALAAGRTAKAGTDAALTVDAVAQLAAAPAVTAGFTAPDAAGVDTQLALREGIRFNWQGLYVEASRVLNDAISRGSANTPLAAQIELQLEAGLADSNIRFTEAASDHFARAQALLANNPKVERGALLEQKRSTYLALDAINRRDWNAALVAAVKPEESGGALTDLTVLAKLNTPSQDRGVSSAVSATNAAALEPYVVDAQRAFARSVAFLSRGAPGDEASGIAELSSAAADVRTLLDNRVEPSSIAWLTALIERQNARLQIRAAERSRDRAAALARAFPVALGHFDCAIAALTGQRLGDFKDCAIVLTPGERLRLATSARVSGPIIAETRIERAALRARSGAAEADVLADYNTAVEALITTGRGGSLAPAGLENYLDLLAKASTRDPASPSGERFFRAIQAVGEPAIARQLAQLQAAVSAGDPAISKLLREREVLKRDIVGLGFQIADAANEPGTTGTGDQQKAAAEQLAAREAERASKEKRLAAIGDLLFANSGQRAVDDTPVTIADLQARLAPDEVYFKITEVRAHTYGMVIGKQQVQIYRISAAAPRLMYELATSVRHSIRDETSQLPYFNVAEASVLYQLLAGPASAQLLAAKAIVVDPGGPLGDLPAGVLVTDKASVTAYMASRTTARNDYSKVAFLARHADLATALSPRSFVDARAQAPSTAKQAFIGFGQHAAPAEGSVLASAVRVGLGCLVNRDAIADFLRNNPPIGAEKLTIATDALGVPDAPKITGAAFSDTAVEAREDLDQYKVVHFATHGVPETKLDCATVPPSLITSIGDDKSDGFLSFAEISALKLDANLVVLSACETSASASQETGRRSGQEDSGRSLDGLVRAFLAAHARAVMATYWQVSVAEESNELFRTFYTRGRTASIGDALRAAQTDLIEQPRYSHPYYWGAYFVVGDASKSMLGDSKAVASR